jgi:hypothetical protein
MLNPKAPTAKSQKPNTNTQKPIAKSQQPTTPPSERPPFIETIVREHARLVMLRSQLDQQRKALPQTNDEKNKKLRRTLTASIQQHSARIETLYEAKENYYNNAIMPDMKALGFEDKSEKIKDKSADAAPPTKSQQPNASRKLSGSQKPSDDRLKKLRALQTRDQNQLDYQTNTRQKEPNPMPESPKRYAIIARMKKRLAEIEKLKMKSEK